MNAHIGTEFMAVRDRAIALSGQARGHLQGLERNIDRGIVLARAEGLPGVLDKLLAWQAMIDAAHAFAETELAPAIAAAMGDSDVTPFSGGTGTGKEDDGAP